MLSDHGLLSKRGSACLKIYGTLLNRVQASQVRKVRETSPPARLTSSVSAAFLYISTQLGQYGRSRVMPPKRSRRHVNIEVIPIYSSTGGTHLSFGVQPSPTHYTWAHPLARTRCSATPAASSNHTENPSRTDIRLPRRLFRIHVVAHRLSERHKLAPR